MAWYHPDLYRRVITTSGTFVNQQWPFNPDLPDGAWELHEKLIPESPRKPIRLWMGVGDADLLNPGVIRDGMHDWVEANHRMASVLAAKGYRYQYVFALGVAGLSAAGRARLHRHPDANRRRAAGRGGVGQGGQILRHQRVARSRLQGHRG